MQKIDSMLQETFLISHILNGLIICLGFKNKENNTMRRMSLKITHPDYHEVRDVATLRNNEASYGAQLMPR